MRYFLLILIQTVFLFSSIINIDVSSCTENGDGTITYALDMQSDAQLFGFQFTIDPGDYLLAPIGASGGIAQEYDWLVQIGGNGIVLGLSLQTIPIAIQEDFVNLTNLTFESNSCENEFNLIDAMSGDEITIWGSIFTFGSHIFTIKTCTNPDYLNAFDCVNAGFEWQYSNCEYTWSNSFLIECFDASPSGCFENGCDIGYDCVDDWEYNCIPSVCECGGSLGEWNCTDDCNGGTCISQEFLGDSNHDGDINVIDIILIVNNILAMELGTPYQQWASELNNDSIINIFDIMLLVNIILEED